MAKQPPKRKYHPPRLRKHGTLKDLTLAQERTWFFNGPCHGYDANDGVCDYGFDCV